MFLERSTAKGKCYLYLKEYAVRDHYTKNSIILFGFGRIETVLLKMYSWEKDFSTFPQELKKLGCTREHLLSWIETLETGKHKRSGKKIVV